MDTLSGETTLSEGVLWQDRKKLTLGSQLLRLFICFLAQKSVLDRELPLLERLCPRLFRLRSLFCQKEDKIILTELFTLKMSHSS